MDLNLTAMIDVIFQLLIYFVVTASFAFGEGVLTARLPARGQADDPSPAPPEKLVLHIQPAGVADARIVVGGSGEQLSSFTELYQQLERIQYKPDLGTGYQKANWPLVIQPEPGVRWQHVVNAFNAAIRAKYTRVRFARTPAD